MHRWSNVGGLIMFWTSPSPGLLRTIATCLEKQRIGDPDSSAQINTSVTAGWTPKTIFNKWLPDSNGLSRSNPLSDTWRISPIPKLIKILRHSLTKWRRRRISLQMSLDQAHSSPWQRDSRGPRISLKVWLQVGHMAPCSFHQDFKSTMAFAFARAAYNMNWKEMDQAIHKLLYNKYAL